MSERTPNHAAGVAAIDATIARMMAESQAAQADFAKRADAEIAAQKQATNHTPAQREAA